MDEDVLIESVEDGIATLTLNRPDSLNTLNTTLMRRFAEGVKRAAEDDAVRVVIVTGTGTVFSAGGDAKAAAAANAARTGEAKPAVDAPKKAPPTLEQRVRWLRRSSEATRLLHEMPKPTIAMINGQCAGAAMSIAGACDFRFAARSARFNPVFTSIGMPGDYGGSWFWTRILGTAKARQLYLIGNRMNSEEALAFGIVDRLYEDDALKAEVTAIAKRFVSLPPSGLAYAKQNLNAALIEPLSAALDRESLNMMLGRDALIAARKAKEAAEAAKAHG